MCGHDMDSTPDSIEWREKTQYSWSGPQGWTICRVYVFGQWRFELWPPADAAMHVGWRASFEAAQALYREINGQ